MPQNTELYRTKIKPTSVPPKPLPHQKHLGYFCVICREEKYLRLTKLCKCLEFEENPKRIKAHINTHWVPVYADVMFRA